MRKTGKRSRRYAAARTPTKANENAASSASLVLLADHRARRDIADRGGRRAAGIAQLRCDLYDEEIALQRHPRRGADNNQYAMHIRRLCRRQAFPHALGGV